MEQIPQDNELHKDERPTLYIDLQGPQGNIYEVTGLTSDKIAEGAFNAVKQLYTQALTSGVAPSEEDRQAMREQVERVADSSIQLALKLRSAMQPGSGKRYEDMLSIVNEHVQLVDISGLYPQYNLDAASNASEEDNGTLPTE